MGQMVFPCTAALNKQSPSTTLDNNPQQNGNNPEQPSVFGNRPQRAPTLND